MSAKTASGGKSPATTALRKSPLKGIKRPGGKPSTSRPTLRGVDLRRSVPVSLVRASHPRQALVFAVGAAVVAAVLERPTREIVLVFVTVLVGTAALGWSNDLVDMQRDRRHNRAGKPLAERVIEPGTVTFALACAVLLVVPLAIAHGPEAGVPYLVSLALGGLANLGLLRRSPLSFVPWAISFGLLPIFLVRGGWAGQSVDADVSWLMIGLVAALGVGVHVLLALPGLVDDNKDDFRHLPLALALKLSAQKVLLLATAFTVAVSVGILITGLTASGGR